MNTFESLGDHNNNLKKLKNGTCDARKIRKTDWNTNIEAEGTLELYIKVLYGKNEFWRKEDVSPVWLYMYLSIIIISLGNTFFYTCIDVSKIIFWESAKKEARPWSEVFFGFEGLQVALDNFRWNICDPFVITFNHVDKRCGRSFTDQALR